ncbi:MAG: aminotransferase class V-fold PLP-dependent enzyme [Planctomycetaceae bacterium]|nr:aminotransferase class V-fold PLP-dependent enzyme [Planctomycetaceae bacterium]
MPRIYLDNAATSFPKPESVYVAVDHYQRHVGAAVGRGVYRASLDVTAIVNRCRSKLAELLGAESPERIVFTCNATDSLNLALHGLLGPGDHVVTSTIEHNSVLRPLCKMRERMGIKVTSVQADGTGQVDPNDFRKAITQRTKLVALMHASNVTGGIQPIAEVGEMARAAGALILVDAAQTAGHVPIDLRMLPVDLLACAGHKGLLGPLGTGVLYIRPGVESRLASLRQGGTGTRSEDDRQPETLPDKYESGNHNAPGLVGLEASVAWLLEQGVASLAAHERSLTRQLWDGLCGTAGLTLFGPPPGDDRATGNRVGVVSLSIDEFDPQDVATILDQRFGIEVRAGLHCAPGVHKALGTLEHGGTVRLSVGPFTTAEHIDAVLAAVREIAGSVA